MKHVLLKSLAASGLLCLAAAPAFAQTGTAANPYSPANGHSYRHGVIPTRAVHAKMKHYRETHASAAATTASGSDTLSYGGGVDGVGVMSGHVKVYVVYYGSNWGAQSTNAKGDDVFSNDPYGAAAVTEEMFKGIGTGNELWSADLTQWCDGAGVASGATSCPSNADFIPYQSGGVYAGAWYDDSAAPGAPTATDLANEAIAAAAHFGNTTPASNRYAYYVIISPQGSDPDNYKTGGFCAWHNYTTSSYGDIAYSNQPYNMDQGSGCGVDYVYPSPQGDLDGWTMTLGHEWHEMMSDTYPAGGWTNAGNGQENSDECAWIGSGQGAAAGVAMATGTFTEQSSWSNDTNECDLSHAILHGGGSALTADFTDTVNGLVANFTDASTDTGGTIGSHSWNFGDGSAAATTANPSHTYAAAGTYSVTETVTDSTGASNSKTASVTVSGGSGGSTYYNDNAYAITDNGYGYSWISVAGLSGNAPASFKVHVNIAHNWSGDLQVVLYAPNGAYWILQQPDYQNDGNIDATWTLDGSSVPASGKWELVVYDNDPNYTGDAGTIESWSMTF